MLKLLDQLILFRFALFSIPWLFVTLILLKPENQQLIWILVAFLSGRTLGMSLNRIVDKEYDRKNPRTEGRPLPSGRLSDFSAYSVAFFSGLVFVSTLLYLKIFLLALIPFFLLLTYSWTKRWTPFCHFWLGAIYLFIPPLILNHPTSWFLGGAFALLITAGDILYALQDREFDQKEKLKSFPAVFGVEVSIWTVRLLVLGAISLLLLLKLYLGSLALALLWGYFIFRASIREGHEAEKAFKICNLWGGALLLVTCLI